MGTNMQICNQSLQISAIPLKKEIETNNINAVSQIPTRQAAEPVVQEEAAQDQVSEDSEDMTYEEPGEGDPYASGVEPQNYSDCTS